GATVTAEGFLDQVSDSFAMLRWPKLNFLPVPEDVCVPRAVTEQYRLRPGQKLAGTMRLPHHREKLLTLEQVTTSEGEPAEQWSEPTDFDKLTPQFPQGRIMLENPKTNPISARAVELLAPLGHGQRGLIVAPPRVGKTILLKEIAKAIRVNHPDIVLILLLVDERPEEVTDLEREIDCQIYHSNFDESVQRHVQVAEMVIERAKRLVEMRQDVVLLLDSITRLSRGYNNMQPGRGRIMSGGVEAKALIKPKKFFGSARNVEEGGSLTVLATALTETGSRMDELIFEEFKGTGNMELHLDRGVVDTEADSLHSYREKLCLLQISVPAPGSTDHGHEPARAVCDFMVDPLANTNLEPLRRTLEAREIVLHSADYDLRMLRCGL